MQLHLILYKTVKKNKLKIWKFQSHRVSSFSAIKKMVTRVGGERGGGGEGSKFVLFLSLPLFVHINFQCHLNSHKCLVIITVNLFSSVALVIFPSSAILLVLFTLFFFINLMNVNKRVLSLALSSFMFKFNSRKTKQTLIVFDL